MALFRLDHAAVVRIEPDLEVLAEAGTTPAAGTTTLTLPLTDGVELRVAGVDLLGADREVLGAFAAQLAVALETRRLQAEAADAEALMQGNELRTALLAAVSHDLRTPLASIKASSSSLLSADVSFTDEQARALLETIDEEADRLNNLVGNLLDMSRIQAGALVVKSRAVGLDEVIGGRAQRPSRSGPRHPPRRARDAAPWSRLTLCCSSGRSPTSSTTPCASPRRARPCASRPAPSRGASTCGSSTRGRASRPMLGSEVFRPFQRLGDSPNGAGVGLGLAVARGFVVAMGGELTAEDTPGGGTTMVARACRQADR